MSRLTRKTNGKDYCLYCDCIEKENEIFERSQKPLSPEEYYKEEPYQMEDSYYLEDAMNRLGKLEDIEEELGCPLEVVFKAYKETIVFKKIDCITKGEHVLEGVKNKLIYNGKEFVLHTCFKYKKYYYLHILELKDYQKTWWLKGEK